METIWNHQGITRAREAAGINAENAANSLRISKFYLSEIEKGKRDPSIKLAQRMVKLYQRPLADFLVTEKIFTLA